jgi:Icc protein
MSNRREFIKRASIAGALTTLVPSLLSAGDLEKKSDSKKRIVRIAHITDVHILNQANAEACFARVLREINAMKDRPDIIINTGDTVMDENKQTRETVEERWSVWSRIVKSENSITIKSALGNHDVWYGPDGNLDAEYKKDKRYGKQWAMDMLAMPARYYTFDMNGWKFIALDSINGENGYQLDDEQFKWLSEKLKDVKSPICIFSHVPIMSMGALMYLTKRNAISEVKFPSGDMHNDHQRIKDLFYQTKNVKFCLSGHVHYIDAIEYLGVKYFCNGAVSGNWWRDPLKLDEFPPVYSIFDLYSDGSFENFMVHYNTQT